MSEGFLIRRVAAVNSLYLLHHGSTTFYSYAVARKFGDLLSCYGLALYAIQRQGDSGEIPFALAGSWLFWKYIKV